MIDEKTSTSWFEENQTYLNLQIERLRLLLYRRILWLRKQWKHDPLQEYHEQVISDAHTDWLLAPEDDEAEKQFYDSDPNGKELTRSIERLEEQLQSHGKKNAALDIMSHLFNLSPFEQDVLLLCLAPGLDPSFERLYGYVQDDVTRKYATPHLALSLFAMGEKTANRARFFEKFPLRSNALVQLRPDHQTANLLSCPLMIDERISAYFQGFNYLDEQVAYHLTPLQSAPLSAQHQTLVKKLVEWSRAKVEQGKRPAINLVSPPQYGKQAIAAALSEHFGFRAYRLKTESLPSDFNERSSLFRILSREAVLMGICYYLDVTDIHLNDKAQPDSLKNIDEYLDAWIIIGSSDSWSGDRAFFSVQMPKFMAQDRLEIWQQALGNGNYPSKSQIGAIAQHFDFGPGTIVSVVTKADERTKNNKTDKGKELSEEALWAACREHMTACMNGLARRIIPVYTWNDIVLPSDTHLQLKEIAAQAQNRYKVYEEWSFGSKLSRGRGINALFSGPSGTGKTMAAEVLANELKMDLYCIDLSTVVSKYLGETEKNLSKVFSAAEQSGVILFFDEADALFAKRTQIKDSHDRYANLEVNYLLQRMEDYRGLSILATNRKTDLGNAFLRRLRFLVNFPHPDAENRHKIWKKSFPKNAPKDRLDFQALARLEIPGGNIRNITLNAAFLAASEKNDIGMEGIMRAARREYMKIEKMITENEFGAWYYKVKL